MHNFYVVESLGLKGIQLNIGLDIINLLELQIPGGHPMKIYIAGKELEIFTNVCTYQICALKVEKYQPISVIVKEDYFLPASSYTAVKLKIQGGKINVGELVEIIPVAKFIENIILIVLLK